MNDTSTTTHSTARKAADAANSLKDDLSSKAQETAAEVKDRVAAAATEKKHSAADEVSSIASSLRRAADDMRDGSPQERTMSQIAEGFADMSDTIRNKDMAEITRDVSAFARQNPIAFLGGAALIGFTAARLAKATARTPATHPAPAASQSGYRPAAGAPVTAPVTTPVTTPVAGTKRPGTTDAEV